MPGPSAVPSERPPPHHGLDPVPLTLCIPLAARALGDALFPDVAVGDRYAAEALAALGEDGASWLEDRASVYGVLTRTRVFREAAQAFFAQHPQGCGANLGCGMSHYAQWVATGRNRWLDADLPQVLTLRRRVLPPLGPGEREAGFDLREPGWWQRLALPRDEPVYLMCEGVLMYLEPRQVRQVFSEIAREACAGSVVVFDTICWLAVGRASLHPLVRRTDAEFKWGPRSLAEIVAPHRRLSIASEHAVLDGYDWPQAMIGPTFRWLTGGPFYGVTRLLVEPDRR